MNHVAVILSISVFLLALTFFYILIQMFLAKYQPEASFYWRRSRFISKICFFLATNLLVSVIMNGLRVFVTVDYTFWQWIKSARYVWGVIRIKMIFDVLDDAVDSALPNDILKQGGAQLGPEISPFLRRLLLQKHINIFNRFIHRQWISEPELASFGNLLAYKLYQQAILTAQFNEAKDNNKARIRGLIAQENIEVAGCYLALVIHFVKKDPRIIEMISRQEWLTYDRLKDIYPTVTKAGELFQILHDVSDFRFDLKEERFIKKISANFFLAQLEREGLCVSVNDKLNALPQRVVGLCELPDIVRCVLSKTQRQFVDNAFQMGPLQGWVLSLSWEYKCRVGFFV